MAGEAPGGRLVCSRALARQPAGEPIYLALGVVIDAGETESGEPARGAWT